jgi:uncharacterized protein YegL
MKDISFMKERFDSMYKFLIAIGLTGLTSIGCFVLAAISYSSCKDSDHTANIHQQLINASFTSSARAQPHSIKQLDYDPRLEKNLDIVFDGSGSMSGERIVIAKKSVGSFLSTIPSTVNVGLLTFSSSGMHRLMPIQKGNRQALWERVKSIQAGGGTPLCRAIRQSRDALEVRRKAQLGYGQYTTLLITDGEANRKGCLQFSVEETHYSTISLRVIGFQLGSDHTLKKYANWYRNAGNTKELTAAMKASLAEVKSFDSIVNFKNIGNDNAFWKMVKRFDPSL